MLGVIVAFILGVIVGVLIAWYPLRQQARLKEDASTRDYRLEELKAQAPVTKPDKLERIEGIGPKISKLLQDAGIATYGQLAATEVSRLEQILHDANLRLADPTTWPDQARLAAAGDWKALDALQEDLKGGRRA